MKKIIGLILYIISLLVTVFWVYGLYDLIFNTCKDCPTLLALIPWWRNPSELTFIFGLPVIVIVLFIIGKKLRK
jgi:hypothetical protein